MSVLSFVKYNMGGVRVSLRLITVDGGASYIEVSCLSYNGRVRVKENFTKTFHSVLNYLHCCVGGRFEDVQALRQGVDEAIRNGASEVEIPYISSKELRMGMTMSDAEHLLAMELKRLGVPFKQQVPIAGYIVDFVIGDNLVVEIEGLQHLTNPEKEVTRLKSIEQKGYEVHRIDRIKVLGDPPGIADYVRQVYLRKSRQGSVKRSSTG
jgi:very-short-patch-repair endonuclease